VAGVDRCIVGYSGGVAPDPTYRNIQDYSEALLIEFDPTVTNYLEILKLYRGMHTPYPSNRQYRSAVFYLNEAQEQIAKDFCKGEKNIDVEPATEFYLAEEYHQNYITKSMSSNVI
jgi:peptide-methionine (S)-S-oxide reductase